MEKDAKQPRIIRSAPVEKPQPTGRIIRGKPRKATETEADDARIAALRAIHNPK